MGDVFKEQLVKQKKTSADSAKKIGTIIAAVVLGFVAIIVGAFLGPILLAAVVFGAYYLLAMFNKEHEYILTNNDLDIDVIFNKQRRKKLTEVDMKKISVMASIKDEKHKSEIERAQKTIDASDGEGTKDTYAIIVPADGGNTKLLITPNEDMLTLLYKQAPHKVHKYRG